MEQDLAICRALCDLFGSPELRGRIAFRGGTAIHKLLFAEPLRYSEDIDLVQCRPEPIGATVDAVRAALSWLGKCSREQAGHSMHLVFRFAPEELFGTKLRALLQRRSGRDLFDLDQGLQRLRLDPERLVSCFTHCVTQEGGSIRRAMAEQRMLEKLDRSLTEDVSPLLPPTVRWTDANALRGFERVWTQLIARIGGASWKRSDAVIEELRATRHPGLLANRVP